MTLFELYAQQINTSCILLATNILKVNTSLQLASGRDMLDCMLHGRTITTSVHHNYYYHYYTYICVQLQQHEQL